VGNETLPTLAQPSVDALLASIRAGETGDDSFRQLFLLYHRSVYGFFIRRGLPPEDCQELTQETFLGIHRGMGSFRLGEPFDPWLFTVAANAYRKHRRYLAAGRRQGQELPLDAPADEPGRGAPELKASGGPEEETLRRERVRLLRQAIAKLPEQMRACLVLRVHGGLKYREIAVELGRSIDTVKTHLSQARKRLTEELGDNLGWREEWS
jgi:RNA polymerase sigma-70 factor, ECF subfamily